MSPVLALTAFVALAQPAPAPADASPEKGWAAYQAFADARRGDCVPKSGDMDAPLEFEVAGHQYRLRGSRLEQLDRDKNKVLRIGVISAMKDDREETLKAIGTLIKKLKKLKMDVLVVNGDIAEANVNIDEKLFPALADSGVLTIVHVGNTETCGYFNQAATKIFEKRRNLINGNWVRQIALDDGAIYTLPGYHDRRFVHTGGAATYDKDDLYDLRRMIRAGPGPKVLVAHGPPKMSGKRGIDRATGAGHVGDPAITDLIEGAEVKVGIFGHILEAGGLASDLKGKRRRKPKKWTKSLYVNAGSASPDPWGLLDGKTSYGMGMLVTVKGNKAKYQVLRLPAPY